MPGALSDLFLLQQAPFLDAKKYPQLIGKAFCQKEVLVFTETTVVWVN